ncbi:extracellular serine protease precursor [mine drainage metagenome]|uniref:Extracellular serine protease n=1 Tax=mine drainage metagenome TaxID=410659 RepID=A0A1J5TS84_9ZZZZ
MRLLRLIPSSVAALALLFSATTSAHAQFLFTSSDIVQTPLPLGHGFLLNLVPGSGAQLYLTTTAEYYSFSTSNIAQLGSYSKIGAFQAVGVFPAGQSFIAANPGNPGHWGVTAYDANYNPTYYDYTLAPPRAASASPTLSDPGGFLPSIAIALDGTVYTREPNNVISKFTSIFTNSTPALTFGNTGPHALSGSGVIALDTTSNVLYATSFPSAGGALMERFNSSGTYLGSFALPVGTNAVYTVDSQGVVYVADMTSSNGYIYDGATGTQLGEFHGNWTSDVNYAISKGGVPTIALTDNGILAFDTGTGLNLDLLDVSSVNAPGTTLSTGGAAVSQPSITAAGNYTIADSGGSLTLTGTGSSVGQILNVGAGTQLIVGSGASLSVGVLRLQTDGTNFGSALLDGGSTLSAKLAGSGTLSFDGGTFQASGDTGLTPISIGSGGATIDSNGHALTDYASMTGTGSLTKQGAGSLNLYGNNSYTGPTTVTGGALQFGNPNALYGGDTTQWDANHVVVQSGATLAVNVGASDEFTADEILILTSGAKLASGSTFALDTTNASSGSFLLPGAIADNPAAALNLEKLGSNTLVLTGANTYSGSTTISDGTLQLGNGGTSGSIAGNIVDNATLTLDRGDAVTLSNVISGSGSLVMAGSGSLTLTSANSFTGTTIVSGGTLVMGNLSALAYSTLDYDNQGGTVSFGTLGSASLGGISGGESLALANASSSPVALTVGGNNAATTYSGALSGAGSLTKVGSGILTLTGANTYTGGTTVTGGFIDFASSSNLGSGLVTLNGGGLQWASGTTTDISSQLAPLGSNGGTLDTNGNSVTFASALSGTGSVTKAGSGTLTLSVANSYSGSTTVSGGSLQFGVDNALPSPTAVSVSSGATLDLNGHAGSVGSLAGSGSVALGSGSLSVGSDGSSTTFSGVIAGSGSLTKTGSGSLTLSGANTYSGPTSVSGGVLNLNGSASNSAFTVASGGTLSGSGSVGALTVASGGTLSPGNSPGTLSAGNTTFAGGGSFTWQINAASGSQGQNPGWDLLNVNGTLTLSASGFNKFSINLASLTLSDSPGAVSDFNPNLSYHFTFLSTSAGISGFDPSAFSLNTSAFSNSFSGSWSVSQDGNDLSLNYASAVPEPSSYATLISLSSLAFVASRRRKSRRSS